MPNWGEGLKVFPSLCATIFLSPSHSFIDSPTRMVHYIRFLRTPQVSDASRKSLDISAVGAVTTDLGDAFLSQELTLIARIVDAAGNGEILASAEFSWKIGARAVKINVPCGPKIHGRLACLQLTTRDTIAACMSCEIPAVVDIWSTPFHIKPRIKSEPLVERRLPLSGKSTAKIWEETGDSIARHIWFVVSLYVLWVTNTTQGCESRLPDLPQFMLRQL